MTNLLALVSVFANLAGTLAVWQYLKQSNSGQPNLLRLSWGFALITHAALLYLQIFTTAGVNLSFTLALSAALWMVSMILYISTLNKPLLNTCLVVLPMSAMVIIASWVLPELTRLPLQSGTGIGIHILSSLLAYAILMIAAIQALVLKFQHQRLHGQQPLGFFKHLPAIQDMEHLLFQLIAAGVLLLSLSLLSGYLHVDSLFDRTQLHKTVLSIIAWLVFAILLIGRKSMGWRGPTAVRWTIWGFSLLALAYFGSKLVREIILSRGL